MEKEHNTANLIKKSYPSLSNIIIQNVEPFTLYRCNDVACILKLKNIWYRKSPRLSTHQKSKYIKTFLVTRYYQLYDVISAFLYYMTFKLISRKDGWVGLYTKLE